MAKLWDKGFEPDEMIERFTVGDDRQLDMRLARYDVEGSMAHIRMLEHIGLLTADELKTLLRRGGSRSRRERRTSTRRSNCCSRGVWARWARRSTPAARATIRCWSI